MSSLLPAHGDLNDFLPFKAPFEKLDWAKSNDKDPKDSKGRKLKRDLPNQESVSSDMLSLLDGLLHKDPKRRLSAQQALKTPFLLPAVHAQVARTRFLTDLKKDHTRLYKIREMRKC